MHLYNSPKEGFAIPLTDRMISPLCIRFSVCGSFLARRVGEEVGDVVAVASVDEDDGGLVVDLEGGGRTISSSLITFIGTVLFPSLNSLNDAAGPLMPSPPVVLPAM